MNMMNKSNLLRILGILDLVVVCACVGKIPGLVSIVDSRPLLVGGVVLTTVLVAISGCTHLSLSAKAPIWYYSSLPFRVLLGQLTFMFLLWTFPQGAIGALYYQVLVYLCFALELGRLLFTLHYQRQEHRATNKKKKPTLQDSAVHG